MKSRSTIAAGGVAALALLLSACGSSGKQATTAGSSGTGKGSSSTASVAHATSAAQAGGMAALVKAAKAEGTLNVITLPKDWANYGNIMAAFTKKYGIKINDANPDGSSQDEINAIKQLKGESRAPDVLDMGTPFAIEAAQSGLLAPYKVQTWSNIPANLKDASADWYGDYGGYVAIGYNTAKIKTPPTSFKSLLSPQYKNEIAMNGNPTEAGAAFAAVYAAALANGGSLSNIEPGIKYFQKLKQMGNFEPVTGAENTVANGTTPILVWWDYLQASEVASQVKTWKIVIPSDAHYAAYYDQAISASAPHPAAARLWEEFLYSTEGQNLWLQGGARPSELAAMVKAGTADKTALAKLPAAPSSTSIASNAEYAKAEQTVGQQWATVLGS